MINYAVYPWCAGRSRSLTVFTGLDVSAGTSTNMVVQRLMAPFHSPGSSNAFRSRPSMLFFGYETGVVVHELRRSIYLPYDFYGAYQIDGVEMGLSFRKLRVFPGRKGLSVRSRLFEEIRHRLRHVPKKGPPPGSPSFFFTIPHTRIGRSSTRMRYSFLVMSVHIVV